MKKVCCKIKFFLLVNNSFGTLESLAILFVCIFTSCFRSPRFPVIFIYFFFCPLGGQVGPFAFSMWHVRSWLHGWLCTESRFGLKTFDKGFLFLFYFGLLKCTVKSHVTFTVLDVWSVISNTRVLEEFGGEKDFSVRQQCLGSIGEMGPLRFDSQVSVISFFLVHLQSVLIFSSQNYLIFHL